MNEKALTTKGIITIGFMMFALFLGAGNLIFPPALGQEAGTSIWTAVLGFLVTGVGLPVLAIVAVAKSGGDLQHVSERAGRIFGLFFPLAVYLAIGPLFGIPRTGSVAFEIGAMPYLESENGYSLIMFLFTAVFFGISYWLALNPSKLVSRVGKLLTPVLVTLLAVLAFNVFLRPPGAIQPPAENYSDQPFFTGFLEGYLTMDAIAALVFGIIVVSRIKEHGITDRRTLTARAVQVGLIAGGGLALVYFSLAYLGAVSVAELGYQENGGLILTSVSQMLLGSTGLFMLSLVITIACLTTATGLISAFGEYLKKLLPKVPYPVTTGVIALFSLTMANMGLTQLIQFSLPMLIMIYPVAIILIVLVLADRVFGGRKAVYKGAVIGAAVVSIPEGLITADLFTEVLTATVGRLPLFDLGVGWLIPALAGGIIGWIVSGTGRRPDEKA
ncbi:branched-chain amino acid transport system II carrier protein [Alteribacter natronophilus]|uniref:branched-chain amino acid transport system II carrier protein n=1 Tax=Alteribacter natronophilus TaxID=2583810 RepID=UPI00110DDAA4|nr:branched-chain amino acid transport system II carrier protein [Alteribacter natronophilus]TMW71737.1 branched-chain amino acid transport system II carrier protein [Alteribacter natronophilus]